MLKKARLVVVDDDVMITNTLKNVLLLEGFDNVEYFNNPLMALEFLKLEKASVIISDFLMPEMNGIDFLTKAKKYSPNSSTILLTGYSDKENAIKAINEVGLYKYIEKPWDNDSLLISIKNGVERSQLISNLHEKIAELEIANSQVEKYSHSLEEIIAEKTTSLIKTNNKLSAIINYCADGILTIAADGKIEQVNPAFENMVGLGANMLMQKNINELLKSEDFDNILSTLQTPKEIFLRNVTIKNVMNNRIIPVEISFAPLFVEETDTIRFVGVIRDVLLQKELDRLRDDFIATLTHDLRTPLLAAIQTLDFFLDGTLGQLNTRQLEILDTMKNSNEDILGLVNTLLEVYKYESGRITLYRDNFVLNDLVEYVQKELKPLAEKKNLNFELNISQTDDFVINADKNELRRVLVNLCANAINHNKTGKHVEIITRVQKNDLLLSVKDDGIGIAKENIPKMFKRFSQLSNNKISVGTGLGLYLSRQIIEAHNGKIWVESDTNKGSEFFFLLPEVIQHKAQVNA